MKFGDELDLCGHEIQNFGVEQRSTYRTNPIGGQLQGHGEHLAYYNGVKWITLADNSKFSNYALATHDHDTIYEPILPPSGIDAELKYLNGNRLWSEIQVSPYSFMRNLYLSHEPSIYGGSLSNEPDTPTPIDTLLIANAEWIIGTFVGGVLEVDTIDKGTWTFNLNMHVELGFTAIVDLTIEVYSLNQSFNQVLLFSKVETELTMSDQAEQFVFSYEVPSIPIDPTLKLIVVLKATSLSDCTLTIQTGPLCYITMPYRMSHTILSEYNKNPLFQHINASDRTILNKTSGKNTGDQDLSPYIKESSQLSNLETSAKTIAGAVNEVRTISLGATSAFVFDTEAIMSAWLLVPENVAKLKTGNNLLIRELNVPDYWWDGATALELEVKIDLSAYYNKSEVDQLLTGKQANLTFSTDIETDKASTTKISAIKTFYDWAVGKFIDLTKIVTSWNATTLNTNIPSEKLVKDSLDLKADLSGGNSISGTQNFDSNTLFVDSVNHKVGVGTDTPTYKLDVRGTAATDGIRSDMGLDIYPVPTPAVATGVAVSGSGLEIGNYYYLLTYYTSIGETNVSISNIITTTAGNQQIQLTIPCSTNPRVIGRKIYRSKVGGGAYEDYSLVTINNNTATTYTDSTPDASLTDGPSKSYFRINTTSKYITLNGNKLLMADANLLSLGINAGYSLTTGGRNTLIGNGAGYAMTSGSDNHLFGVATGRAITSGGSNCGFGYSSLYALTTGSNNTAYGHDSLFYNATGQGNTIMGTFAQFGVSGSNISYVTAIGMQALQVNQGSYNTALGYQASVSNSTGSYNTALGNESLKNNTTGQYNVGIGYLAGWKTNALDDVTVMNRCIYIGYNSKSLANNQTNEIVIGAEAVGNGTNTVTVGNNDIADTYLKGRTHVTSSIQINNDTASASAANAGAIRYRADANNSYVEMCMQTGASTYAWIIIKQNTW